MNKVTVIGRLTKDPELKFTPGNGTAVCTFTLAVDRQFKNADGKREADFIPIVAWRKPAETIATYSTKGKLIAVSGRLQTRSYDAKDGTKRYVTEIITEDFQILEWANSGQGNSGQNSDLGYSDVTSIEDGETPF